MQKTVIGRRETAPMASDSGWIDLETEAAVEVTSENPDRPVESALGLHGGHAGWRAAEPGPQTIRLTFIRPQNISRFRLRFVETERERTQEFSLRWVSGEGGPPRDVVRQQWNFSPQGSTTEVEDYQLNLNGAVALELNINPDVSGRQFFASLEEFRVA